MRYFLSFILAFFPLFFPLLAFASEHGGEHENSSETTSEVAQASEHIAESMIWDPIAIFCLFVFIISYLFVLSEEKTHLRKSKPVILGAGIIWILIGIIAPGYGIEKEALHHAIYHGLGEYGSLLLFLIAAMTYINAMKERNVFSVLRAKLIKAGLNLRQLFWATGVFAFFLSPIADNLTTALVLGAVVMAVASDNPRFIALSCINIVNAANAGGAFSPFGDITTLMVWQAGKAYFFDFFELFSPSLVCFLVPAAIMHFFVPTNKPWHMEEGARLKKGAKTIIFLGLCTIATAVCFEQILGLPPFLGMMTGLSVLMIFAYFIHHDKNDINDNFDIFKTVQAAEWDTLLFFFGVIFSVGGLGFLGYLEIASNAMYEGYGYTATNIALGVVSAVVDNIPVMFAVLTMDPEMTEFQWLLVTLTTGIGGSLLSIGSAAGVALMGVARGHYTFFSHLKWTPVMALGYAAAIATHFALNG